MNRARRVALASIASIAAAVAVAPSAFAASDYFLKVDQVAGESVAQDMKNAIDVRTFSWGVENGATVGSATTGAGGARALFDEVKVEKSVDATSPTFYQRLATGQHFPAIELVARRSGAAAPYLRYCFTTAIVSDIEQSTDDEGMQETITFRVGGLNQQYTRQSITGGTGTVFSASWSQILNKAFTDPTLPAPCGK